tara:strand:+ start:1310 stop:2851 length:1542 start_codon:yes stop_codon:yes gene_type:complete
MAQLILNVGANANDGTGDTLRAAMIKVNSNFTELYNSPLGASSITISGNKINANASNADLELMPNGTGGVAFPAIRFDDNNIVGTRSNENINLLPAGTGKVVFGSIGIAGTTLSSDDSSSININEGLIVDGTANISGNVTLTGAVTMESTLEVTGNTTLANLTVTGTSTFGSSGISVDNLNINDNIISSDSNADIILSPGGTGSVVIGNLTVDSNINIQDNVIKTTASNSDLQLSANGTGVVDIASALTTAAVTTVGDWSVTGTHTISGQLDVDYVRIKDNAITTNASSANLEISANGSGVVKIDDADIGGGNIDNTVIGANTAVAGTFTTVTATTSIVIDGVTIADNTVSTNASNSNLELSGNGTGGVRISGFTFPTSDGSSGQFLKTDGAGTLAFATAGATLSFSAIADATTTIASSATTLLNTFAKATSRSCKYFVSITDATNTRYELVEVNVVHDGSDAYVNSFGSVTNYTGPTAQFTADISGSNVRLFATNITADSMVFKFQRIAVDV